MNMKNVFPLPPLVALCEFSAPKHFAERRDFHRKSVANIAPGLGKAPPHASSDATRVRRASSVRLFLILTFQRAINSCTYNNLYLHRINANRFKNTLRELSYIRNSPREDKAKALLTSTNRLLDERGLLQVLGAVSSGVSWDGGRESLICRASNHHWDVIYAITLTCSHPALKLISNLSFAL